MDTVQTVILLTASEAAAYVRVTPSTLRRWVRQGKLHRIRLTHGGYRYSRSELDRLLAPQEMDT